MSDKVTEGTRDREDARGEPSCSADFKLADEASNPEPTLVWEADLDKLRRSWSNKVSAGGCGTDTGLEGREAPELRTSQSSSGPAGYSMLEIRYSIMHAESTRVLKDEGAQPRKASKHHSMVPEK